MSKQFCVTCAWRENCAKKFCVPDGGARCPDYSRDISIKNAADAESEGDSSKKRTDEQ